MDKAVNRKKPPPEHFFGRVLRPRELLQHARYAVTEPAEELRPWVQRYWSVAWDLPAGETYGTATVSEPMINLTVEHGALHRQNTDGPGTWLTGPVSHERFDVSIYGTGGVIGVRFRLGGTLAFSPQKPADIRDTTVPANAWFPGIHEALSLPETIDSAAEVLNRWLCAREPRMTEGYSKFQRVLQILETPTVTTLGELAAHSELSERTLQRMFQEYCGVGVKKVLIRARVMDAVAAMDRGWDETLTDLAAQYGWFDQSHFTADFHRVTGYRPAEYFRGED